MTSSPNVQVDNTNDDPDVIYCDRKNCPGSTGLRCYQTDVPICMQCAVRTPVGYISVDAAKARSDVYYNIQPRDYLIVGLVGFFMTLFLGFLAVALLGFLWFIMLFVGPAIGGAIGETAYRAIERRRGRRSTQILAGSMVAACILLLFTSGNLLAVGLFSFTAIGAAASRMQVAI